MGPRRPVPLSGPATSRPSPRPCAPPSPVAARRGAAHRLPPCLEGRVPHPRPRAAPASLLSPAPVADIRDLLLPCVSFSAFLIYWKVGPEQAGLSVGVGGAAVPSGPRATPGSGGHPIGIWQMNEPASGSPAGTHTAVNTETLRDTAVSSANACRLGRPRGLGCPSGVRPKPSDGDAP